ncbi:MAG: galactose oxidase early set domain-containing protein [Planctomycetota bacterium]
MRVLLFTRQLEAGDCAGATFGQAWLWRPTRSPTVAHPLPMPSTSSSDPFCSGHAHLPDGDVLVAGGLDYQKKCDPAACEHGLSVGHSATWRLDVSSDPPVWTAGPSLLAKHWYPTVIAVNDGVFVAGHGTEAEPGFLCDTHLNPKNHQIYQRWNASPATGFERWTNYKDVVGDPTCLALDVVSVFDYPRLHMLASGEIIMSNAARAAFLDIANPPPCTTIGPRWKFEPVGTTGFFPRRGGNSAHLIYRDAFGARREVVYSVGGTDGHDDDLCLEDGSGAVVTGHVEKMIDPNATKAWVDTPPLNHPRFNHNLSFLLDGSLVVTGGSYGEDLTGGPDLCNFVRAPERMRPPELFGGSGLWVDLGSFAPQPHDRGYHAIGGLLPDGRYFSGGGTADPNQGHVSGTYHTIDIFAPAYYFQPRPQIQEAPTVIASVASSGQPFSLEVTRVDSESEIAWVALVKPSSTTHAFDMGQRYVQLAQPTVESQSALDIVLTVPNPLNLFETPPGMYLLVVVEEVVQEILDPLTGQVTSTTTRYAPSIGHWVRVE